MRRVSTAIERRCFAMGQITALHLRYALFESREDSWLIRFEPINRLQCTAEKNCIQLISVTQSINNLFMKVKASFSGLLLLCTLFVSASAITYYNATFDTYVGYQATYDIGYIGLSNDVIVNLTDSSTDTNAKNMSALTVKLLNGNLSSANTSVTVTSAAASVLNCTATTNSTLAGSYKCITTAASGANQRYYVRVILNPSPTTTGIVQYFQMTVGTFFNTSNLTNGTSDGSNADRILFQGTEVIRDRVIKLVYIATPGSYNVSFYPQYASATNDIYLYVIQVAPGNGSIYTNVTPSALTATSVNQANSVTNMTDNVFNFNVTGYYLITVHAPELKPNVRVMFPSDSYTCPYNSNFPDYKQNFQPCLGSSTGAGGPSPTPNVPGYPCTVYDPTQGKCTQCASGFNTSTTGTCLYNTACPARQYYHFGTCYNVSPKCNGFDAYTGDCTSCIDPLNYVVNGFCIPNPALIPNCTSRQYLLNNVCVNVSPLCQTFDPISGGCTSCIANYVLSNSSASCVPQVVTCPANQYNNNGTCVNFPANCGNFDSVNKVCQTCNFGYYLNNGACVQIVCATGKVPSKYGLFCIDVSPSCNQAGQYDPLTGDCLQCKYSGYTVSNGVCVQNTNPLSSCAARQALGYGACPNATVNCQSYNLVTGNCDQCLPGYFKDYTGICSLQNNNAQCASDQISIQGYCVQKPANCLYVDNLGLCTTCINSQYQLQNGQCIQVVTCPAGQYLSPSGTCVNVPAGCSNGGFNPSTGVCLTCNDGSQAVNGLCCTSGLVAYQGQCITAAQYQSIVSSANSSNQPVCIAFHPTLGYCIQCNGNYQVDPTTMNSCI